MCVKTETGGSSTGNSYLRKVQDASVGPSQAIFNRYWGEGKFYVDLPKVAKHCNCASEAKTRGNCLAALKTLDEAIRLAMAGPYFDDRDRWLQKAREVAANLYKDLFRS